MVGSSNSRARKLGILLTFMTVGCFPGKIQAEDQPASVELECRLAPAPHDSRYETWIVQLRQTSGLTLRQVSGGTGGTVRFKKLVPAIYVVCVHGERDRSRCESVDLYPPKGEKDFKFSRDFTLPRPALSRPGMKRISVVRLAVPRTARRELARYEECRVRGDEKAAVEHLERALLIYPAYPEAINNLGAHYHRSGDYAQSVRLFRKVTELDPDYFAAWINLGGSLLAGGQFRQALEAQQHALGLRPDDVTANAQAGLTFYYLRQYDEARRYFLKVAEIDPESSSFPHIFLAQMAMAMRQNEEAGRHIRDFLELHPNAPRAAFYRRTLERLTATEVASRASVFPGQPE